MARINLEDNLAFRLRHTADRWSTLRMAITSDLLVEDDFPTFLFLDPMGSTRSVFLPAIPPGGGLMYHVSNVGSGVLEVRDDGGALIDTVTADDTGILYCSEEEWVSVNSSVAPNSLLGGIIAVFDGGSNTVPLGIGLDLEIPFDCTITEANMYSVESGSIVIDIWKDSHANFPPTIADSIVAAAKPTISASNKSQDSTLTGWTTSIAAGDILRFNVDSVATIKKVTLILEVLKLA